MCIYPDWTIISASGEKVEHVVTREFSKEVLIGEFICIPGPGSIFRTEAARIIGGRNGKWKYVSDYEFWLRLSNIGDFERIPKNLAYWRTHENSTSIKYRSPDMARERIHVIEEFLQAHPEHDKFKSTALSLAYFSAARICFFSPEVPARRYLLLSFLFSPKIFFSQKASHALFIVFTPLSNYLLNHKKRFSLSGRDKNSSHE